MTMTTASFPMYNLPEMRALHEALWQAIAEPLRASGIPGVPDTLDVARAPVPDRIGPEILFTQTCGYPLQTIYRGQHAILAIPEYDAPHCSVGAAGDPVPGPTHCALFLVREDDPARSLADLRGRRFACNSLHSNSGMNLPRRTLAPLADGRPMFAQVAMTGSHPASMALVRSGGADATAVDNLTHAFHADHRPAAVAGLRVLATSVASPAIPFITGAGQSPETVAALRRALDHAFAREDIAPVRRALRLRAVHAPDAADYTRLLRYEAEAAALSYPVLA